MTHFLVVVFEQFGGLRNDRPEFTGVLVGQVGEQSGRVGPPSLVVRVDQLSATASDPDYVRSEAEFLLNPNRLNVAMSRMKKKLVIVASESVFEVTPPDADEFDQTLIWKRLYDALGVTENSPATATWNGELSEFCPESIDIPDGKGTTNMEVYALSTDSEDS